MSEQSSDPPIDSFDICPHCKKRIHEAPFRSLSWLFSIAALFLMIPGFFLPIISVEQLGVYREVSFVEGLIDLYRDEKYLLAGFLFSFSFLLPIWKNVSLVFLCSGIGHFFPQLARILYTLVEFFGAWGKLEIFVTAIVLVVTSYSSNFVEISINPAFMLFVSMILFSMTASWLYE
jgi:paraquat-inducible protein A